MFYTGPPERNYGDVETGPHQFLSDTLNQLQPERRRGEADYAIDIPTF